MFFRFICNCLNCNYHCNDHIVFLKFETIVSICSAPETRLGFSTIVIVVLSLRNCSAFYAKFVRDRSS